MRRVGAACTSTEAGAAAGAMADVLAPGALPKRVGADLSMRILESRSRETSANVSNVGHSSSATEIQMLLLLVSTLDEATVGFIAAPDATPSAPLTSAAARADIASTAASAAVRIAAAVETPFGLSFTAAASVHEGIGNACEAASTHCSSV
eukprot:4739767-Pleurochrysis_carterae.AAC.3